MKIRWLGHSAFLLENAAGNKLVMDPYDEKTGYTFPNDITADVVTISHGHSDHAYTQAVKGDFAIIDTPEEREEAGFQIHGVKTFHDDVKGAERGENIAFIVEADGLRIVHLGDLGHAIDEKMARAFGKVDILMDPVGGVYTTDSKTAADNAEILHAQVVIPMHYKTDDCSLPLLGLDPFLNFMRVKEYNISQRNSNEIEIEAADFPKRTRVFVMDYK